MVRFCREHLRFVQDVSCEALIVQWTIPSASSAVTGSSFEFFGFSKDLLVVRTDDSPDVRHTTVAYLQSVRVEDLVVFVVRWEVLPD